MRLVAIEEVTVVVAALGAVPLHPVDREGPAGEGARHVDDVLLAVAGRVRVTGNLLARQVAVRVLGAEAVQLDHLAGEILVRSDRLAVELGGEVDVVVEIDQHRGRLHDRFEHLAEVPQRVGADDVAVVVHPERRLDELPGVDVEVVVPEVDQNFEELALRVDRPGPGRELGLDGGRMRSYHSGSAT